MKRLEKIGYKQQKNWWPALHSLAVFFQTAKISIITIPEAYAVGTYILENEE